MASSGKPGFWGGLFGHTAASSEGDRFTLDELRRLHAVLTEEKTVTGALTAKFIMSNDAEGDIWKSSRLTCVLQALVKH
jgi:hypothetical protein